MYFPEDIMVEIMSKLPSESLIRFKCVNKSWYALIHDLMSDPIFVDKHLNNIKNNIHSPSFFIELSFSDYRSKEKLSTLTFNYDFEDYKNCSVNIEDVPSTPGAKDTSYVATYHSNGIICLVRQYKNIMLWNPALREVKFLPKPRLNYTRGTIGMGFGFDSRANDYKFISISASHFKSGDYVPPRAEVYNLSTNSWREIKMPMLRNNSSYVDAHLQSGVGDMVRKFIHTNTIHRDVYSKGVLYWLLNYGVILSFNMSDEVFCITTLPENLGPKQGYKRSLMAWNNDSIALLYYPKRIGDPLAIEIWITNDILSGVKGCSWSKYHDLAGPLFDIWTPLMIWKSDELMVEDRNGRLVSYNLRTQNQRKLYYGLVGHGCAGLGYLACTYVKSLVSVIGRGQGRLE